MKLSLRLPLALAALVPCAWAQSPPEGAIDDDLVDGVLAVVNDDIVTQLDIEVVVYQERLAGRNASRVQVLERYALDLLRTQAGRDMGFEDENVEAVLDQRFESVIERQGGAVGAAAYLASSNLPPDELRDYWRRQLFAETWEAAITGRQPSAGGRISVDRYVRPGRRYAFYRALLQSRSARDRALAGAVPERVVLQELILPLEDYGGEQDTRVLAGELVRSARVDGQSFTDIVSTYSAVKDRGGMLQPIAVGDLGPSSQERHGDARLFDFAQTAGPNQLSEPMLGRHTQSGREAVYVYRMEARLPASDATPFVDASLQANLDRELLGRMDELRLSKGLREVGSSAYLWPPYLRGETQEPKP